MSSRLRNQGMGLAALSYGGWLYSLYLWATEPERPSTKIAVLMGFMAFGMAPWVAPIGDWSGARGLRLVSGLIGLIAFIGLAHLIYAAEGTGQG
jgi:hypothetical protein